jgi:hypothetical protein
MIKVRDFILFSPRPLSTRRVPARATAFSRFSAAAR